MNLAFLIILASLSTAAAWAAPSSASDDLKLIFPDPTDFPAGLVQFSPTRSACEADAEACAKLRALCAAPVAQVLVLTEQYKKLAFASHSDAAQAKWREIDSFLAGAEKDAVCGLAVTRAYVVDSLRIRSAQSGTSVDAKPFAYVTAFLMNVGTFKFAPHDPSQRILGSYECASSTITIDPRQPPLNLAGIVIHELDHLFRDKFTEMSALEDFRPAPTAPIDWTSYVLMDETLAIGFSGYFLRSLSFPARYWISPRTRIQDDVYVPLNKLFNPLRSVIGDPQDHDFIIGGYVIFSSDPLPYRLTGDLSLVRRDGPFSRLWERFLNRYDGFTFLSASFAQKDWEDAKNFFDQPANKLIDSLFDGGKKPLLDRKETWEQDRRIYRIVFDAYFAGAKLADRTLELLRPERHGAEMIPLAQWHKNHFHTDVPSYDELMAVGERLGRRSGQCTAYLQAVGQPNSGLERYLGNQNDKDSRLGSEGVKPEDSKGLRPCLNLDQAL